MSLQDQKFSDEKFMSAAEKTTVLRAWIRFLESGCKKSQFTEALYHHLSQHCSFIAHYDRHGFYNVYFERHTPQIFRFFDQFDSQKPGVSAEYGTTHWLSSNNTGSDLNAAMREAACPYLDSLRRQFAEIQRQTEIAQASRLLAKHGLTVVPASCPTDAVSEPAGSQPQNQGKVDPIQPQLFTD